LENKKVTATSLFDLLAAERERVLASQLLKGTFNSRFPTISAPLSVNNAGTPGFGSTTPVFGDEGLDLFEILSEH